jgi:hypothetical protein
MVSEIAMWTCYGLLGWAVLIYAIATLHALNMSGEQSTRATIAASTYVCATLLLAFAVRWMFII